MTPWDCMVDDGNEARPDSARGSPVVLNVQIPIFRYFSQHSKHVYTKILAVLRNNAIASTASSILDIYLETILSIYGKNKVAGAAINKLY